MKVVMPIAGRGSRFLAAGITTPKPLINILGKPMIKWATDSLPMLEREKLIFIVRKEHIDESHIDEELQKIYGKGNIEFVVTDKMTEGAACTVLLAKSIIDTAEDLIIYNTDQYFSCDLEEKIRSMSDEIKGIIPVFHATHPKWSYARIDEKGYVTEVREKEPISTYATVGLYYFRHGHDFVWAAEEMIRKDIRVGNEFYVCPVYNELIARGDKIILSHSTYMWGLGTPEDVEHFEKHYRGD